MQENQLQKAATDKKAKLPLHIEVLLGDPPVLSSENISIYEALRQELANKIQPQGIIEWSWVKDLVDLIWDIRRYRSQKPLILDAAFKPGLEALLRIVDAPPTTESITDAGAREAFPDKWFGSAAEKAKVSAKLAKYELDENSVRGHAFLIRSYAMRDLEILIERAELRRDLILREIAFYRESLAEILDPLTRKLIDETEAPPIAPPAAHPATPV